MALIMALIGVVVTLVCWRYLIPAKTQIQYIRERDHRGEEYTAAREEAISLETDTKPSLRFFKRGPAYKFIGRLGRSFTRFFGKEGTAYTWTLEGFDKKSKPVKCEFPTLEKAVEFRWGELYEVVPEGHKELLRKDKIHVTVGLEPGITPKGYKPITEQTITTKAKEDLLNTFVNALKNLGKPALSQWIFIFGAGIGAGYIACTLLMG